MDEEQWATAFEAWLEGKASAHTRAAYRQAWDSLLAQAGKMPWEIQRADLRDWLAAQQCRGASPGSIHLRLAAVRSFYRQLQALGIKNPAAGLRPPRAGSRRVLSREAVAAFLAAIPTHTLNGSRDYALLLCYLTSRRSNSQVRLLKHEQIVRQGERMWLVWRRHGRNRRQICPERLRQAIERYLSVCAAQNSQPQAYLFTAWPGGRSSGAPLSLSTVCKLVKKYARQAGLGSELTVRTLQSTAREERGHEYHR